MAEATGRIFEIQRFSIHDGPGIRTTVFLQGCPLSCLWCHNPEGRSGQALISFQPDKCIDCGYCFATCQQEAHQRQQGRHVIDRDACLTCGACTVECYSGALEKVGREAAVDEVLATVLEDEPFYALSGGGMTLSGGEPLCQFDFAQALLAAARERKIHTVVETCGAVPFAHLKKAAPFVELFLYDLTETDAERHREFTGMTNELVIENLKRLYQDVGGARIRLRLPLIPGYNDRPEHFAKVVDLVSLLPGLEGVEIMPYHRLGASKPDRFGLPAGIDLEPPSAATVDGWIEVFTRLGLPVVNRKSDFLSSGKRPSHVPFD